MGTRVWLCDATTSRAAGRTPLAILLVFGSERQIGGGGGPAGRGRAESGRLTGTGTENGRRVGRGAQPPQRPREAWDARMGGLTAGRRRRGAGGGLSAAGCRRRGVGGGVCIASAAGCRAVLHER